MSWPLNGSDLEQRISERKFDVYKPMIDLLGQVFNQNRQEQQAALRSLPEKTREFATWLTIYGSDDAILAFRNYMQGAFASAPTQIQVRLYAEFILAARRDIGYANTEVSPSDLLGVRIKDLYSKREMHWSLTSSFEELCASLDWSPPWLAKAPRHAEKSCTP